MSAIKRNGDINVWNIQSTTSRIAKMIKECIRVFENSINMDNEKEKIIFNAIT